MPYSTAPDSPALKVAGPQTPMPGRRSHFLLWLLAVLVLIAIAWSILWYLLVWHVGSQIDEAIAREAKAGRVFSCASRETTGFPFQIALRCDKPRLEVTGASGKSVVSAPQLTALGQITDPNRVTLEVASPLSIEIPGRPLSEIDWKAFSAAIEPGQGIGPSDLVIDAPALFVREGQNMSAAQAERLELHTLADPASPPQDDAVKVMARLTKLTSPLANALTGEDAPADAQLSMSVSHAASFLPRSAQAGQPQSPLERWRLAGGKARIDELTGTKGSLKAAFSGNLGLDEQHMVAGMINATIEGAQGLLPRLGLPPAVTGLVALSGSKLKLPIVLARGRLAVGPFAVARLLPLY